MTDFIIFIYVMIAAFILLAGSVNLLNGVTDTGDEARRDTRWGARMILMAPFWPVALIIFIIIKAELFKRR